jgi:hypothetical protein
MKDRITGIQVYMRSKLRSFIDHGPAEPKALWTIACRMAHPSLIGKAPIVVIRQA